MKRYLAFLRGINISGKNKIPMAELQRGIESLGFAEVKTYLNSGNVIFSSDTDNTEHIKDEIEKKIKTLFNLNIPVFVISEEKLEDILHNAPDFWGNENKEVYDNLIFIIPPAELSEVLTVLGKPDDKFEKIKEYKEAIFWSFDRKNYRKSSWWSKTASAGICMKLTIRTANTIKRIIEM